MTQSNPFPEHLLNQTREQTANAVQRALALKTEADEAAHIQKVWEDLTSFLNRDWFLHILALLDKEAPLLKKMRTDEPAALLWEEIYRIAKERAAEIKPYRFPAYLEEACRAAELPLDQDSCHPRYKFKNGFFQLDVDKNIKTARLSDYESPKLCEFPADIGAIVEAVQLEYKRVFGRPFDGEKFIRKLRSQYLAVVKKQKLLDGSSVPIRHITRRLGKNEDRFRTDEFLIDLSRLIEQGLTEVDGWRLELQQTKDTSQGMLLHIEPKRYFGLILFKKV
jgi:hypothetical protein